jgi:hypothetical protein
MQQVFNPLLLYFQLVHFYNNAEKKRKSFRGKTPAFFFGRFFQEERLLFDREEFEPIFCRTKKSCSFCLGADEPPPRTRKMQKEKEFTTRTTRGQRENIY